MFLSLLAASLSRPDATAADRYGRQDQVGYEACGRHLSRMFNVFEQIGLRGAKAFENNIDDEQGWHGASLKRLALAIPGVRRALIPPELRLPLKELKAFRHVVVHAYDLQLDPQKLALVLKYAGQVANSLPRYRHAFPGFGCGSGTV